MPIEWKNPCNTRKQRAYIIFHQNFKEFLSAKSNYGERGSVNKWSGLGGKRKCYPIEEKIVEQTATRELLEELFQWEKHFGYDKNDIYYRNPITNERIAVHALENACRNHLNFADFITDVREQMYVFFIDLNQLNNLLRNLETVCRNKITSSLYMTFPVNVHELMMNRKTVIKTKQGGASILPEISKIKFDQLENYEKDNSTDKYFLHDVQTIKRTKLSYSK